MIPLIAQHESWLSIDPIQGCPATCIYCYLGPQKLYKRKSFFVKNNPVEVYDTLEKFRFFDKQALCSVIPEGNVPICIGNYTDMCLTPDHQSYLIKLLIEHKKRMPKVPVCVVTKAKLTDSFLKRIEDINVKIVFTISLSFFPKDSMIEMGVPYSEERLQNFEYVSQHSNIKAIHFWRPITSLNVKDRQTAKNIIQIVKNAGAQASVITGLKFGNALAALFHEDRNHELHEYFERHKESSSLKNEIFEPKIKELILEIAQEESYPVYLHTSCALSFIFKQPDYNGTFRKPHLYDKCLASTCPENQRERCFLFKRNSKQPSSKLLENIAKFLHLPTSAIDYSNDLETIRINSRLTQEEQSFLTQVTSFPIRGTKLECTLEWVGSINR